MRAPLLPGWHRHTEAAVFQYRESNLSVSGDHLPAGAATKSARIARVIPTKLRSSFA
jgi:hypothetical protein